MCERKNNIEKNYHRKMQYTIIWTNVSYAIIYAKCSEKVFTKYISGFLFDIFIKLSKNLVLALVFGNTSWHILSKIYSFKFEKPCNLFYRWVMDKDIDVCN